MGFYYVDFSCRLVKANSADEAEEKVYKEMIERGVVPVICSVQEDSDVHFCEMEDYVPIEQLRKEYCADDTHNKVQFGGDTGVDADYEV